MVETFFKVLSNSDPPELLGSVEKWPVGMAIASLVLGTAGIFAPTCEVTILSC